MISGSSTFDSSRTRRRSSAPLSNDLLSMNREIKSFQLQEPFSRNIKKRSGNFLSHGFGVIVKEFLQLFCAPVTDGFVQKVPSVNFSCSFSHRLVACPDVRRIASNVNVFEFCQGYMKSGVLSCFSILRTQRKLE